jgi:AcrR family transcriptional regulator
MLSRRAQNRARLRESILEAATSLFAARGFDVVTMNDIAVKAGVVRATVFNHFPSKHSLIEAITEDVFGYYTAIVERALAEEDASVPALLTTLLVHMGEGIESAQQFYSGVFREILRVRVGLDARTSSQSLRGAALEQLEALTERGRARGELRTDIDARQLARGLDALSMGTIIDWLYEHPGGALRDRMETAAALFLQGAASADVSRGDTVPGLVPFATTPTGPGLRSDVEEA